MSGIEKVIDYRIPLYMSLGRMAIFISGEWLVIWSAFFKEENGLTGLENHSLKSALVISILSCTAIGGIVLIILFLIKFKNGFTLINNRIVFKDLSVVFPYGLLGRSEIEVNYSDITKVVDMKMNRYNSNIFVSFNKNGNFRILKYIAGRKGYCEISRLFNEKVGDRFEYKNLGRWPQ